MSAPINDGGPAFPRADGGYCTSQDGMTLRDYFAGQALPAIITKIGFGDEGPQIYANHVANAAYLVADAMIVARGGAK